MVAVEDVAVRLATDRSCSQPRGYCVSRASCVVHPGRQYRAPSLVHLFCATGWPHGMSAGGFCPLFRIASLFFCRHCFQSQSGQPWHWHSNSFCAIWIKRWQGAGAKRCKQKQCRGQSFLLLVLSKDNVLLQSSLCSNGCGTDHHDAHDDDDDGACGSQLRCLSPANGCVL